MDPATHFALHLGPRPDPRLVASLRAMRGVVPSASGPADESLPAWLAAVRDGGAAALARRTDLPSERYVERRTSRIWKFALGGFLVPTGVGAALTLICRTQGDTCSGPLGCACLGYAAGGALLGLVAANLVVFGWKVWKLLFRDGAVSHDPAQGRGDAIAPGNRFHPVEALLSGGAPIETARRYGISEATLTAWVTVYLDGAQTELKSRCGSPPIVAGAEAGPSRAR